MRCSGSELLARRGVGLDGFVGLGHRPEVLLQAPSAVARVLQDRDAGEIDRARPRGVIATVLHVDHHAARGLVDGVPLVGRVELGVLRHDRLDPGADLLPPVHRAQHVLDVLGVLGEQIGPGVPILAHRAGSPVGAEGLLHLVTGKSHAPSCHEQRGCRNVRRRSRSTPRTNLPVERGVGQPAIASAPHRRQRGCLTRAAAP